MNTLYAGPWVGEFGWELFCWQGYIRRQAQKFDECVVACRKGHETLYLDFADVVPQDISCQGADMWECKGYEIPSFEEVFGCGQEGNHWIPPSKPILRYDHTHRLNNQTLFARFKDQDFVHYGSKYSRKGIDLIIHARSQQNKVNAGMNSNYRNWPIEKWEQVLDEFPHLTVGCIGTQKGASHVAGADLRDLPLNEVCDALACCKAIIGPSSGPIHLAALCCTSQVIWYGPPYDNLNEQRYLTDWNPFGAPVKIIRDENWNPSVTQVIRQINDLLLL